MEEEEETIWQKKMELVNARQIDDFTPVHYACHRGNLKILELLLANGGDLQATSKNGVTCLHLACVSGNLELVKFLLNEHNFDVHIKSAASGSQPIHVATSAGHQHIVEYLINECGADPCAEDKNQENCLTLAIKNRNRDVALWLVATDKFALDSIIKRRGFNYFAYALVKGQQVIANAIREKLLVMGLATPEVINQRIATQTTALVTLFDLCLSRRYKAGLSFLLNVCKVDVPPQSKQ